MTRRIAVLYGSVALLGAAALLVAPTQTTARARSRVTGGARARAMDATMKEHFRAYRQAMQRGDHAAAERALDEWGKMPGVYGKDRLRREALARLRTAQGRTQEAADAYTAANADGTTSQSPPTHLTAWAVSLVKAGRDEEARKVAARVLTLPDIREHPVLSLLPADRIVSRGGDTILALDRLIIGDALLRAGNHASAADQLRAALEYDADLAPARLLLGRALLRRGDAAGARREFDAVSTIRGAGDNAVRALARAEIAAQDREVARREAQRRIEQGMAEQRRQAQAAGARQSPP